MKYKFGDIVLITFPFVDSEAIKKRPALVLLDSNDNDIIAARITSQIQTDDYTIEITEWKESGLLLPSVIKLNKIATISKTYIYTKLGHISEKDFDKIKITFMDMWKF